MIKTINTNYTLSFISEENRYIVISEGSYFNINKFLYELLYHFKNNSSSSEIVPYLKSLFPNSDISAVSIDNIINSKELTPILFPEKSQQCAISNKYIWLKVNIIDPLKITLVLKALSTLFVKKNYNVLFTFSVIVTIMMLFKLVFIEGHSLYLSSSTLALSDIVIVFIIFQAFILIHELGHAAAAYRYNVTSKSIGFGLYFIFPVFFTELSEIWTLSKKKRLQVNVAGIFFQLLINVVLVGSYYIIIRSKIISTLFLINTISLLISFNPFFRYDGYWILSDFLAVPNLRYKATQTISILFSKNMLKETKKIGRNLLLYSVLLIIFWAWVYLQLANYVISTILQLITALKIKDIGYDLSMKGILLILILIYLFNKLLKSRLWTKLNIIKKFKKL